MKKYNAHCIVILLLLLVQVPLSGMQNQGISKKQVRHRRGKQRMRLEDVRKMLKEDRTEQAQVKTKKSELRHERNELISQVKLHKAQKAVSPQPAQVSSEKSLVPPFMLDDEIVQASPAKPNGELVLALDNKPVQRPSVVELTPNPIVPATQAPVQIASLAPAERSYFWQTLAGATGLTAVGMYIWYNFIYKTRNKEQSGELQSAPKAHVEKKS